MIRYLCIAPSQYLIHTAVVQFHNQPGFGADSSGACLMNKCGLYDADVEMNSFFANLSFCRPAFFYISIGPVLLYFPLVVVYSLILAGFCGKGAESPRALLLLGEMWYVTRYYIRSCAWDTPICRTKVVGFYLCTQLLKYSDITVLYYNAFGRRYFCSVIC